MFLFWRGLGFAMLFLALATALAVLEPRVSAALARFEVRQQHQQQQGRVIAAWRSNLALSEIGSAVLAEVPSAARFRVAVIHRAEPGAPMRFDVTLALGPRHNAAFNDVPLSQWQSYLDDFLVQRCAAATLRDGQLPPEDRAHLVGMRATAEVACALTDSQGNLLGAALLTWDDPGASVDDVQTALDLLRRAATQVSILVPEL